MKTNGYLKIDDNGKVQNDCAYPPPFIKRMRKFMDKVLSSPPGTNFGGWEEFI